MKIKWFLLTIVLNTFALLMFCVILEYNSLTTRMQSLENNIKTALDTAVDTAMASEEFFSDGYADRFYSYAQTLGGNDRFKAKKLGNDKTDPSLSYNTITLYRPGYGNSRDNWISGNLYVMSHYFSNNNRFPNTETDIETETASFGNGTGNGNENYRASIYSWLYGRVGQYYTSSELKSWSSTNQTTLAEYGDTTVDTEITGEVDDTLGMTEDDELTPQPEFLEFYKNIGYKMTSKSPVKVKSGDSFEVKVKEYPTLWNMGVTLDAEGKTAKKSSDNDGNDAGVYDFSQSKSSDTMSDNWCSSYHVGKIKVNDKGIVEGSKKSIYMLTPMSLGVTYVPVKVAKPAFAGYLENILRYSKIKDFSTYGTQRNGSQRWGYTDNQSFTDKMASANGCIATQVHVGGSDYAEEHDSAGNYIMDMNGNMTSYMNDGQVEYNMDSIEMKVDYFYVNFADPENAEIVNRCLGAIPELASRVGGNSVHEKDTATRYYNGVGDDDKGKMSDYRIVAKVSVRMRVQVPYQQPLMQWSRYMTHSVGSAFVGADGIGNEHFGIKALSTNNGRVVVDEESNSLWFECSTYRAISR